ncbi:DNA repair protein RadA [Intrasporangium chromatireducens Q5-1]|uniref:DNA repair protein RadA n=1 Tax=Intrasporangium chromatireducens Q5-1 TaxID=584657 RepID=W9GF71_9MICO|nr:DNA repair protein RadA [Intrasporangium chromatireducens]EWT04710.1 DNA repair protein RadA [Intrasporangium chromatireducens Q5-1]
MASRSNGKRAVTGYRCTECGWSTVKWVGRCGECQAWGSVTEVGQPTARTTAAPVGEPARPIGQVDMSRASAETTGVPEFDRVLGGGLVPGAVVLVAGEPGVGKSTLLLDVAARTARSGRTVLYVSGEESAAQVRGRAERIGALADRLLLAAETDLGTVLGHVEHAGPDLLVVDSVQTIASAEVDGQAGNVSQVREVTGTLIQVAKSRGVAVLLVGHVTKDGSVAGPRVLEHLVDAVVQFEGDRHSRLRLVRAVKNRFGPTDEVGCFELRDSGIVGLADPSGLFLSRSAAPVPGTCVTVAMEGRRPLVTELQSLITASSLPSPRRTTSGLDASRLAMILAVLEKRSGLPAGTRDVFAATVGGMRVTEPAADLAILLSLASSAMDRPLARDVVALGEVGLSGELRPVPALGPRLTEAARLGFRYALVPEGQSDVTPPAGITPVAVPDVRSAVEAMGQLCGSRAAAAMEAATA